MLFLKEESNSEKYIELSTVANFLDSGLEYLKIELEFRYFRLILEIDLIKCSLMTKY